MTHIYSSKILLYMSITRIYFSQMLTSMMCVKLLVKILLQVMDLNMNYKTQKTSQNTRNSDFRKNREINQVTF